jgi:hypothetical protein
MSVSTPLLVLVLPVFLAIPAPAEADPPVPAAVVTTLRTGSGQIRQLAFDGDGDTFFASAENARAADHFTLVFDRPVAVKSIAVLTGRPDGQHGLGAARLEVAEDGKTFAELARFAGGKARADANGKRVQAVRIQPEGDLEHVLVVRELAIEAEPPVAVFKYPIEIEVDVSDAPEMKEWADNVARICERSYPMINEELWSEGFKPRQRISMVLRKDYNGVAQTGGGRITGSVKFFKEHPDDVGAMVHETIHNVQAYQRRVPGWLTEGVCDYIRFFKFEPGKLRPPRRDRARYNGSYKVTAQFLAFVCDRHGQDFVRKLNAILRKEGYREELWKELTGKTVQELEADWKATLVRRARI